MRWTLVFLTCAVVGCAQPALLQCPADRAPCADGCVDLSTANTDCGACGNACGSGMTCTASQCVPDQPDACAIDNGGCGPQALCMDIGGVAECLCGPGTTGDGHTCNACSGCVGFTYVSMPCTPTTDTVCTACAECSATQYMVAPCMPSSNTVCQTCDASCFSCNGPGPSACTSCPNGSILVGTMCVPMSSMCGNGVVDVGEECDDGNPIAGDGCSSCTVESGWYCFEDPGLHSSCRPGTCVTDPLTALPLGPDFDLDGVGTAGSAGLLLSQRSTIHTTADVVYPIMVEADVTYSAPDITFIGARSAGLRVATDGDEPTDSFRARLSAASVDLAAGPIIVGSMPTPFTPQDGVRYHVRWIDDGSTASVIWWDTTNPNNGTAMAVPSTYHGGGDKAFVGGGDMGGATVANVRACSAPTLPVTQGLIARYSAMPSWTALQDDTGAVLTWQDVSGNGNDLTVNGTSPHYQPGLINGHGGLDFTGAGLASQAFPLTTDVTVFAVIVQNVPQTWGAIAHHGSRDDDWSMEQAGPTFPTTTMHWQTNNDNTNESLDLLQNTSYVLTGRFAGLARYFSAAKFDGAAPAEVSIVDASHTITTGAKVLYVGTSDNAESSNAFIADFVYFDRALTDVERDQVIDYLRRLWRP